MEKVKCSICNGQINTGEPIVQLENGGLAHRFRQTCDHELLERIKKSKIESQTYTIPIYDDIL